MIHRYSSVLRRGLPGSLLLVAYATPALGQIAEPGPTTVRERIVGQLLAAADTPEPAAGDMIGAFFDSNKVCGRFVFSGTTVSRNFNILIYGDVASTTGIKEGPSRNQRVTFQFYDASANTLLPITVLTKPGGEPFNFTYQGQEVPPIPIDLPGLDLTPSRDFDMRIGGDGGGGGGGGGGGNTNRYDINGDGRVTIDDAALILRQVSGGNTSAPSTRTVTQTNTQTAGTNTNTNTNTNQQAAAAGASMDVNRDQRIDVNDAIEVLRNKSQ